MKIPVLTILLPFLIAPSAAQLGGGGAESIISIANKITSQLAVPTTLTPSQTAKLQQSLAAELFRWQSGAEFTSLAHVLDNANPTQFTATALGTGLPALPTEVQEGLAKEKSALQSVQSSVLSGGCPRETGTMVAGALAAAGVLGAMLTL